MPKSKFELSKRHSALIDDVLLNIPTIDDMKLQNRFITSSIIDHKTNTIYSLIDAIQILSKDTQYESTCNEIVERAKAIIEYYDNN